MVDQKLIEQVRRLPVPERLELIEMLTRSLREELAPSQAQPAEDAVAIVNRLFGILRTDGQALTDEEIKEDYTNYLIQKYS